jgi:hypothetical protein
MPIVSFVRHGIRRALAWLRRRPPHDPFVGVRVPKGKAGPSGRTSAIALDEPRESQSVNAIGGAYGRYG